MDMFRNEFFNIEQTEQTERQVDEKQVDRKAVGQIVVACPPRLYAAAAAAHLSVSRMQLDLQLGVYWFIGGAFVFQPAVRAGALSASISQAEFCCTLNFTL